MCTVKHPRTTRRTLTSNPVCLSLEMCMSLVLCDYLYSTVHTVHMQLCACLLFLLWFVFPSSSLPLSPFLPLFLHNPVTCSSILILEELKVFIVTPRKVHGKLTLEDSRAASHFLCFFLLLHTFTHSPFLSSFFFFFNYKHSVFSTSRVDKHTEAQQ